MPHDMHIHTKYSCDAKAELSDYCAAALERGVSTLCFTDHLDCNPCDDGYGYYNAEGFFADFYAAKEQYGKQLTLLCGVEFAEPQLYPAELAHFCAMDYDFILGSVHFWYKDMFPSVMLREGIPLEVCYRRYWQVLLGAVRTGGFDALAHLDFPKRYYGDCIDPEGLLPEIVQTLVKNGICPEINTSSLRKGCAETLPGAEILALYRECGGKYVTIGSDAHAPQDLAADNAAAQQLIKRFGFQEIIFRGRERLSV